MKNRNHVPRRLVVKSSVFGMLAATIPNVGFARHISASRVESGIDNPRVFHRYPSIDDEVVAEAVGASHFNLGRVTELVTKRPELARATWDWAFGDWETALGAASHVGRRDIAEFLMSQGARPDIFTYAMFGSYESVKSMIEATPGIQQIAGPHGITLLQHAKNGLRQKDNLTSTQIANCEKLIAYLEELGDADITAEHIAMKDGEKEEYLGDYMYGEGPTEGLSVKLNMRKLLSLGKLGSFGGSLYQIEQGSFAYNGISSVRITFQQVEEKIVSLTINEPDLTLVAKTV